MTTADQYDLARTLAQATRYGETCAARHGELVDAIEARNQLLRSVQAQLNRNK